VIITELDKAWVRAATAKLIRQGKLKRRPCEICGARETLVHHIDYTGPEHIKWSANATKAKNNYHPSNARCLREGCWPGTAKRWVLPASSPILILLS
jgi:hypothetical protein